MTDRPPPSSSLLKTTLREVLSLFALTTGLLSILYRFRAFPVVDEYLAVVAALLFLYLPAWFLWKRGHELEDYGLRFRPIGKSLLLWVLFSVVVLVPFGFAYDSFVQTVCPKFLLKWIQCPTPFARSLRLPPKFLLLVLSQVLVVALPEEFFFRGFVQKRLAQTLSPSQSILLQSALFALGHYLVTWNPASLLVFFPGLLFGLLRHLSQTILPGTLFHATCNLTMELLKRSVG
ncbi:MAG TPA: type II CAAX endopeptidase family protein [Pseudomonadota bacterium]|nr:type II CAAX endopeptidase family protein [Pseudomonadota bacterium]